MSDYKEKFEKWRLRRKRAKAAKGRRATSKKSTVVLIASIPLLVDIALSDVVPGANDNASGTAALIARVQMVDPGHVGRTNK